MDEGREQHVHAQAVGEEGFLGAGPTTATQKRPVRPKHVSCCREGRGVAAQEEDQKEVRKQANPIEEKKAKEPAEEEKEALSEETATDEDEKKDEEEEGLIDVRNSGEDGCRERQGVTAREEDQQEVRMQVNPIEEKKAEDSAGEEKEALSQETATDEDQRKVEKEGLEEGLIDLRNGGEDGEEGRQPVALPSPLKVSQEERAIHELTHTPYRAWCKYCVRARGRNSAHRTREEQKREVTVPRVVMDYFFMSQADEKASQNPMLVMVDETTGEKYARAVGFKGLGQDGEMSWLIRDLSDELKCWGHPGGAGGHIIIKADGEPAIRAVMDAVAKYHGGKVVPDAPPRGRASRTAWQKRLERQ